MKRYRVYFNRLNEAPQVWSIDEGTQASEINVHAVVLKNCAEVSTWVNPDETVNHDRPKAWMAVEGVLTIENGVAVIRGT
jgi:hypothetical protein